MSKKGIALILVVSILAVVAIMVVSFIFTMRMEARAAANYLWQVKAGYIAEAGIIHAMAILDEDKDNDFIDSHEDAWRGSFSGGSADNNDDGTGDSRWIEIEEGGEVIGRYAVLVEDESAKININSAGFHNESPIKVTHGATAFEVSLENFLQAKGVSSAKSVADAIIEERYGADKAAGEKNKDDNQNRLVLAYDGIDNDADGEADGAVEGIDEPTEFVPYYPYGDDKPFLSAGEIQRVSLVSSGTFGKVKAQISAYAQSASTNRNRDLQWDVNSIDAQQLLDVFLRSGVTDAWQRAVNVVDFADRDFAQSVVAKSTTPLYTQDQGPKGDWTWKGDHYESKTYGGIKGSWTWTGIEAGEYFLILHGTDINQYIGDVTVEEVPQMHLRSGETFTVFPSGTITIADGGEGTGSLTIAIQNNESLGTTCYFKYIELVSAEGKAQGPTVEIRGTEGVRINEIMAKPIINLVTTAEQAPGGDWLWQGSYYKNSVPEGGATGQGTWLWTDIPDGEYYLTVYASAGQDIGDVLADGTIQENMHSGERFVEHQTVTVSGGTFRIDIQNNLQTGSCYFQSARLSQQPDAEYIELVNLTDEDISLDGWGVEATGTDGWPASIPLGTTIEAGEYLVLAVDQEDNCSGINGNGISFEDVWGGLAAVQLDFSRSVTDYSDMIDDSPTQGKGEIILRDEQANIVDIQEYFSSQLKSYLSLEKGDPTCIGSPKEIWFDSEDLSGATPAKKNNNDGIIKIIGGETIEHNLDEVWIKNSPLANLGQISQVTTGSEWQKIGINNLRSLADRLTVFSMRLEAEGHLVEGEAGNWSESLRSAPQTSWFVSENKGEVGTWLWDEDDRLLNGVYTLYLYGESGQAFSVSFHLADDSWSAFSPALTPGVNKSVCYGRLEIGAESVSSLPDKTVEMHIKNESASQSCHFDYIKLTPLPYVAGKININTAPVEVLEALPMIDKQTAQRIINERPLGNKENKARGIGDLLYEDILDDEYSDKVAKFSAVSNLVTVRSDTYRIIATGQAVRNGKVMAEKRIRAVIER